MSTIRQTVISNLLTQLSYIKTLYGYSYTHGDNIVCGRNQLHESELPGIIVLPGTETIEKHYSEAVHEMPIAIKAYRSITSAQAVHKTTVSTLCESSLGDLIINVFGPIFELDFTLGNNEISEGDIITGKTSGATARVIGVTINSGTWAGGNAAGTLKLRYQDGVYQSELIQVAAVDSATIAGNSTRIYPYGNSVGQILYDSAGIDIYPDPGESVIEIVLNIRMQYTTAFDNPYV
jgi:hypothetical protein